MELVPVTKQALTRAQFERLADVPPEEEWLANIVARIGCDCRPGLDRCRLEPCKRPETRGAVQTPRRAPSSYRETALSGHERAGI